MITLRREALGEMGESAASTAPDNHLRGFGKAPPASAMRNHLLSASEAAERLGITRATLYQWLAASDAGGLVIRGQPITIDYYQSGGKGQGRIKIEIEEVERLKEQMRVRPHLLRQRRPRPVRREYPGIYVELGDPGD